MDLIRRPSIVAALLLLLLVPILQPIDAQIGVCYGRNGNNLPSEQDVVNLYESNGIGSMRIYDPDQAALSALGGSNIQLMLDVPNDSLQSLGSDPNAAVQWVQNNIVPYASNVQFKYIAVGNEVMPSDPEANSVLPAMQNVQNALTAANLGQIKVSTSIKFSLLGNTYPPSAGSFSSDAAPFIQPIVSFLQSNNAPLLANVYPYFSYTGDEADIGLPYALFTAPGTVVTDSGNGLQYQNLFDAMMDALYAALGNVGAPDLGVVVSESGWPSAGGDGATAGNAGTYYQNLINHVPSGTPKRSGSIETYLFAMFDENEKASGVEQNFGVFTPTQQAKYQLSF